jgi:PAS domain S-box-containing protein
MAILLIIIVALVIACIGVGLLLMEHKPQASTVHAAPKNAMGTVTSGSTNNILEAVSDGVVLLDEKGTITMLNPAASYLSGWSAKDALGIDHALVFRLCDAKGKPYDATTNPFSQALQDGKPHRDNNATLIVKGSEKHLTLSLTVSPLTSATGQLEGAVGILRDVSEERAAERQRAEFISTASHEMRTPIAAIEGYLALAMNERVSKIDMKARGYLAKAHESTSHLGSLFQDLLTSAKAEDGRLINHPQVIEMGDFLSHLTEDLRFVAQKKNLTVEFVVGVSGANMNARSEAGSIRVIQPVYNVYADPERLREVITNLFDNAVKYTDSGKISLGLTGDDNIVQLYVKDTGKGIPSDDIPHLFQKFYRVDNSATRSIGGTGLGLFISRKIIEMYNGRIWVESEAGRGSTFFINLPRLSREHAAELAPKPAPSTNSEPPTSNGT